jgi:hypothetical protein
MLAGTHSLEKGYGESHAVTIAQTINVQSIRSSGAKYPSVPLAKNLALIGVYDADTFELGWYLEWNELRLLWERYFELSDVRLFGRKCVLATDAIRQTGEIPPQPTRVQECWFPDYASARKALCV